jgi:hypothetical protein
MFPSMVFCILSRDRDFVDDMASLLSNSDAEVFVASSFTEYARLQEDGLVVEMLIVDPVFKIH